MPHVGTVRDKGRRVHRRGVVPTQLQPTKAASNAMARRSLAPAGSSKPRGQAGSLVDRRGPRAAGLRPFSHDGTRGKGSSFLPKAACTCTGHSRRVRVASESQRRPARKTSVELALGSVSLSCVMCRGQGAPRCLCVPAVWCCAKIEKCRTGGHCNVQAVGCSLTVHCSVKIAGRLRPAPTDPRSRHRQ